MRGYAGLYFFCAVLTFVSPSAPSAAESAAEYRAPVAGAKLGPAQPVQPAQPAPPGVSAPQGAASPMPPGQPAVPAQSTAPAPYGTSAGPTPWPSGGMMPYSAVGTKPASGAQPDSSAMPAAAQPSAQTAVQPAGQPPNAPTAQGAPAGPAYAPGYAPAPQPQAAPNYGTGYVPYPTAPYSGRPGGDVVYGTSQIEGNNPDEQGTVVQYRDPQTGDIVTSVIPPQPPDQQNYGTFFVAPQIYPNGNNWGGNSYVPTPRPGQPYAQPPVMWQPPVQYGVPPEHNKRRHSDRRHEDHRTDGHQNDGRYNGPPPPPYPGPYPGQHQGQHTPGNGDRYDTRPGAHGTSPYDQRDADRSRDGRERQ